MRYRAILCGLGLTWLVLAACAGGCVNVKVDADGLVRKYTAVSNDEAIRLARLQARDEGVNPDDYRVSARKDEEFWWVWFDEAKPTGREGWPAHFIVRVDRNGLTEVFRGK